MASIETTGAPVPRGIHQVYPDKLRSGDSVNPTKKTYDDANGNTYAISEQGQTIPIEGKGEKFDVTV